ncbi:hypothetical protein ACVR1I_07705 [Streptococcus cameli]
MSTSVTKKNATRLVKTVTFYICMTIFLFLFSRIYETLSYGEVSFFMHYLFVVPLIGGGLLYLGLLLLPNLSRATFNLWNSGVAIITTGFLFRGIVNLSGRSTTLDTPYWYVGGCFLILTCVSLFLSKTNPVPKKA